MKRFENKVVLVTGGATGIGLATAIRFAEEGAKVVIASRSESAGGRAVDAIKASGGEATFIQTDVSQEAQVEALIQKTVETYGKLDAAFNNSGTEGMPALLVDDEVANYERIFDVNVKGLWLCMKHEIKHMLQNGGGSIVNNASIAGLIGFPHLGMYAASKHAVLGLTKSAALENGALGIRINAVSPAMIETDMAERFLAAEPDKREENIAGIKAMHPIGRFGKPEEIASAVTWLCSDDASFMLGHSLTVDGGFTAI
ncbi:3-oxoacyl-[acyl-carrier protein] reductase [hydrothermal vent metagenome]|uniref:3-oxoacyl-[acyl-carrier protein] reductase n=1 Tax=hydrothermal vent metagenome TaxID=652676 RepID=A0A3B0YVX8_9ZZZZ